MGMSTLQKGMSFKRFLNMLTLCVSMVMGAMLVKPLCAPGQAASADLPRFMPNVVHLTVTFSTGDTEQGFGFIVGEEDLGTPDKPDMRLYVATANHVVRKDEPGIEVREIKAKFCASPLRSYPAYLLEVFEPDLDFTVLEIARPFAKLQWETDFFDPNPVSETEAWFLGLQGQCLKSGRVNISRVSYKGRIEIIDTQIQPGTSGAPLISDNGLIGIVTRSEPGKAEAVNIDIIQKFAREKLVPWGLRQFTTAAIAQPTPIVEPTMPITVLPTITPTVKPPAKPTVTPAPKSVSCWDAPEAGTTCTEPITGMEFVYIPGGTFQMGCLAGDTECYDDEKPAHTVKLDGFWMGKYEVTNAQYRKFKSDHDSQNWNGKTLNGDDQPVVNVSWDDATDFVKWLTTHNTGNNTFRLPTEAEREYAARAGTITSRYWGDNPDNACRYANVQDTQFDITFPQEAERLKTYSWLAHDCDDKYAVTSPVGKFKPNGFGLYDMLGNVWEWCADWYGSYSSSPQDNPRGPSTGSYRVKRGGGWDGASVHVRAATRNKGAIGDFDVHLGFRLVKTE